MDLGSIQQNTGINNGGRKVSFQGNKTVQSDSGKTLFRVYPPYIELNEGEELGVELVRMSCNDESGRDYSWSVVSEKPVKVEADSDFRNGNKTYLDIDLKKYRMKNSGEFGYRYVVYDKNDPERKVKRAYADSAGSRVSLNNDENAQFTVASTRQGPVSSGGSMMHVFIDSVGDGPKNILAKYAKNNGGNIAPEDYDMAMAEFKRNHANKAGGTINGLIDILGTELAPYTKIMTNPLIGGGKVSSHMYHPSNHYKISAGVGTKNDFLNLQKACFNSGKNYVLDGAFTSQGYEGTQFNHALRHPDSPFKYWFKGADENGYQIGVLPNTDNKYTGIRIVNPKDVQGYKYNPDMPTYIQFYDTRLASEEQLKDQGKLIENYDNYGTDDPYEINVWDDVTLNNFFPVDPNAKGIKGNSRGTLEEWSKKPGGLQSILSPEGLPYSFTRRGQVGGTTPWDGNIDMVKMNLSNHINSPEVKEGNKQAQNYLINIGKYWTSETRNALISDIAQRIHGKSDSEITSYLKELENNFSHTVESGTLQNTYESVKSGEVKFDSPITGDTREGSEILKEQILNFPLESLNFSPELIGTLSTPFITPRPSAEGDPTASKAEIFQDASSNGKLLPDMQKVYDEVLPSIVTNILNDIQTETGTPIFEANGNGIGELTDFGKYFVQMSMNDIMQFVLTQSLFENAQVGYKDGKLDYEIVNTENGQSTLTLNKLGINETTSKTEAQAVADKLEKGLRKFPSANSQEYDKFKNYLEETYAKYTAKDYETAEAILNKTKGGLNWRFDAAKDVGDFDEARNGIITSEDVMTDVINFWKPFVQGVRSINPSSFVVGEVTSLHDFDSYDWGKFGNAEGAERAFYEETGATTGSNYSVYFGLYPKLFGKNIEEGAIQNFRSISNFIDRTEDFLLPKDKGNVTQEFITGSHVFLDNHDKPRAAHLMAVDSELFWSDFKGEKAEQYKSLAQKVLNRPYSEDMNSKAVAVADKFLEYFKKEGSALGLSDSDIDTINKAIVHTANGYDFLNPADNNPDWTKAESFGGCPYEVSLPLIMKLAEKMGLNIPKSTRNELMEKVRLDMVNPYISKMSAINEMMVGTTGIPTLFEGDEFTQTGCETRSKNWLLGCRNPIRHDWINENSKEEVKSFYNRLTATNSLCKKPGMSVLANGTPVAIRPDEVDNIKAATKDEILAGLKKVGKNNFGDIIGNGAESGSCSFLECVKNGNGSFENVFEELEKMPEDELKENLLEQLKDVNPGMANWVRHNIEASYDEVGAMYKYNERGEGVITLMTNAFIPKDPNKTAGLLPLSEAKAPKISDITLKDDEGNLIAKPNTKFVRKTYDEKTGDYIDNGTFILSKEGKLIAEDNSDPVMDSTVNYFCKINKLHTKYTKPVG